MSVLAVWDGAHLLNEQNRGGQQPVNESNAHRIFVVLKRRIFNLGLLPGASLSEADVAKTMGVSRQPVREAFIKLADAGLVEIRPKRGTFVRLISKREVANARFVREAIEVAVARKAATEGRREEIEQLGLLIEAQERAVRENNLGEFFDLDERFHCQIAVAAECDVAWGIVENLKAQFDRMRYLGQPNPTALSDVIQQHHAIARAISEADADAAAVAVSRHMEDVLDSLPRISASRPELFVE
jgi:DNA-binding GntR family transcriptional regulator